MSAARMVGIGATLVFAGVALASGMDRIAERQPAVADWVPAPFRVNAARVAAGQALDAGQTDAALAEVRLALRRDPVDPRSSALAGLAWLERDDARAAHEAFSVAGRMGWRDVTTQLYWLDLALRGGNLPVAAQRLDAILRQSPQLEARAELLAPFEASGPGRAELARRLALRPAWSHGYFGDAAVLDPDTIAQRADVALRLAREPGGKDCAGIAPLAAALGSGGMNALAQAVRTAHCSG